MGFRLPGKSVHSGTSGHRSALKMEQMKVNEAAIAAATAAAAKKRVQQHKMPDGSMMDGAQHSEGKESPAKNLRGGIQLLNKAGQVIKYMAPTVKTTTNTVKKIGKAIPDVIPKTTSTLNKVKNVLGSVYNTGKKVAGLTVSGLVGYGLGNMGKGAVDNANDNANNNTTTTKKKKKSNGSYSRAKKNDPNLESYIAGRKKHAKGSPEYNAFQNKINKAYGSKTRHGVESSSSTKGRKTFSTLSTPGIGTTTRMTKTQRDGDVKLKKSTFSDDRGVTTKKTRTKRGVFSDKVRSKKSKFVTTGAPGSNLADKKTKIKTRYTKSGDVKSNKRVTKQDGMRTVTKTNRRGKTTTKTRKTLNPFD